MEKSRDKKHYTIEQIELFANVIPAGLSSAEMADMLETNLYSQLKIQDMQKRINELRQS